MLRTRFQHLLLPEDRGPLRVMFVHTEVVVGGAETLLVEIIRRMDRERFEPELCCLKRFATLGEVLAKEIPAHVGLLEHKYDYHVLGRLSNLFCSRKIDAVVTIGTGGDRMFWGRLAAWRAKVPVILSALHATGYPMKVELINRMLAPITDGFIGCASTHSEYLVSGEKCPTSKVFTVWNGVDTERFRTRSQAEMRARLSIPEHVPVAGIVAALRPEKQHVMLVEAWARVVARIPDALLLVVGDGVERIAIEGKASELGVTGNIRMLGMRQDVPEILSAADVKVLSSRMEANPASTLEAGACGLPVVAPHVGSLPDTVIDGETGLLVQPNHPGALSEAIVQILSLSDRGRSMGRAAQNHVRNRFSVGVMVGGYECLIDGLYRAAVAGKPLSVPQHDQRMENLISRLADSRSTGKFAEESPVSP